MPQADTLAELDALIVAGMTAAGLSDAATFTPDGGAPVACTVLVDRNVSLQGELSAVVNDAVTITVYRAEVDPDDGDTFTIGAETFVVDSILSRDESRVVCVVTPES